MVINLRPHQELAVSKMSNGKVLIGGVGTGKTPTALAYYFTHVLGGVLNDLGSVQQPVDLYILTTAMKRDSLDWQKWAAQIGISVDNREDSIFNIRFVIDSYNNIKKYKDVRKAFFIFDEQRLVGAGEWSKNFIKIAHNNQWIMLSATPGDTWMDYIPLFIANRYYKNRTEFKRRHCVFSYYGKYPKLERYLEEGRLLRLKQSILVDMPYEKHTKRHISQVPVKYDVDLFRNTVKKRWNPYEEKPLKDASELFLVMRKIVNSDSSRIEALRSLIQKHPRLIVYYNFDYELHALRSLADSLLKEQAFKSKKEQVCQDSTPKAFGNGCKGLRKNDLSLSMKSSLSVFSESPMDANYMSTISATDQRFKSSSVPPQSVMTDTRVRTPKTPKKHFDERSTETPSSLPETQLSEIVGRADSTQPSSRLGSDTTEINSCWNPNCVNCSLERSTISPSTTNIESSNESNYNTPSERIGESWQNNTLPSTTKNSQSSFETTSNSSSRPNNGILSEPISLEEACQLCQNDRSYGNHSSLMWTLEIPEDSEDYDQASHISMRSRQSSLTTTMLPISRSNHSSATSKDISKTTSPEDSERNTVESYSARKVEKRQCETTPVMGLGFTDAQSEKTSKSSYPIQKSDVRIAEQNQERSEKCQTSLVSPVVADTGVTTKTFAADKDESLSSRLSTQPSTSEWKSFAVAEWNGHKHQPIPETDSWLYFVQYASGAEGWNCTSTDAMVFFSLTYSYKYFAQAQGRIDRMNTLYTDLYYYILMSGSSIDLAVSKALKNKRNFNEKDYIDAA